jgi:hypothetical protein
MEWAQEEGVVRAGVALHAGRLLDQYARLTRDVPAPLRHEFIDALVDEEDVEIVTRFPDETEQLKPKAVIEHLRNALSHPTVRHTSPDDRLHVGPRRFRLHRAAQVH